jgi:hypothetical protein
VQGSVFCAVAVLILAGGPGWLQLVAALGAAGSLVAFGLSRTVGLFGFTETGWQPAPYAAITVVVEVLTLVLVVAAALRQRPRASEYLLPDFSADKSDESHVVTLTDAWVIRRRLVGVFRQPGVTRQSADGFLKYKERRTTHS